MFCSPVVPAGSRGQMQRNFGGVEGRGGGCGGEGNEAHRETELRKRLNPGTDQQTGCQALLDSDPRFIADSLHGCEQMTPRLCFSFS